MKRRSQPKPLSGQEAKLLEHWSHTPVAMRPRLGVNQRALRGLMRRGFVEHASAKLYQLSPLGRAWANLSGNSN